MVESLAALDGQDTSSSLERRHGIAKSRGVHYTPPGLAAFVARRVVARLGAPKGRVLDPACGDGELLLHLAAEMAAAGMPAPHLVGVDRDAQAITVAQEKLKGVPAASVTLHNGDFLEMAGQREFNSSYDIVISNPPYVRTQVLGAARSQVLARRFDLTGRVDLYQAFVAAITAVLGHEGTLGLLCSNRFLTTKGGESLRALLSVSYELAELWDLGDTRLFEAAVLPAVLVGRRSADGRGATEFVRVYEDDSAPAIVVDGSLLDALEGRSEGAVSAEGRSYNIERGHLADKAPERPWRLTSSSSSRWLAGVRARSAGVLGDIGPIRVGIKTTADAVFIRESWDDLPDECRPEDELLRPLLTHHVAERWHARECDGHARSVLYTHEIRDSRRRAIDISRFPRAAAYLEQHRDRLEARSYVRKAGREWYEIWVPQQPDGWEAPKLVWPDISERPRFFLDTTGAVVNGDCYWLSCAGRSTYEMSLALAVANSSFALRYYDTCCGNRLYAGRRRFITQYLEGLPMPDVSSDELRSIAGMVDDLRRIAVSDRDLLDAREAVLDEAVDELFGLKEAVGDLQL